MSMFQSSDSLFGQKKFTPAIAMAQAATRGCPVRWRTSKCRGLARMPIATDLAKGEVFQPKLLLLFLRGGWQGGGKEIGESSSGVLPDRFRCYFQGLGAILTVGTEESIKNHPEPTCQIPESPKYSFKKDLPAEEG